MKYVFHLKEEFKKKEIQQARHKILAIYICYIFEETIIITFIYLLFHKIMKKKLFHKKNEIITFLYK